MNRKLSYRFATPRWAYGQVERALAAVFELDSSRIGALRGRLKNFNLLGLPGLNAGKGARVLYTEEQVCQWLVALLMSELGIDPSVIVKLVKGHWERHIRLWVKRATDTESKAGNPVFMTLRPCLLSGPQIAGGKPSLDSVRWIGGFRRWRLKDPAGRPIPGENVDMFLDHPEDGWLCARNLTHDIGRLLTSLDAGEEPDTGRFGGVVGETP